MTKYKTLLSVAITLLSTTACIAQSGLCYEMRSQSHTKQMDLPSATKIFLASNSEDARIETKTNLPFLGKVNMITLVNKNDPAHTILMNEKRKLYAIQSNMPGDEDTADISAMAITKINDETVNGFPCVHLRLGDKKDSVAMEIWLSKSVPGYEKANEIAKGLLGVPDAIVQRLKKAGYDGFQVKFVADNKSDSPDAMSMTMELLKVYPADVSESMLTVPTGFTETKGDPFSMSYHSETKIDESFKSEGKIGDGKK